MNAQEEGGPVPKIRVLVADDPEVIANTLATVLELAGYALCAVYGGAAAERLLEIFKPDLVVTDITSAGLTGVEVAFASRTSLPRCKVLLYAGHRSLHTLLRQSQTDSLPFDLLLRPILPSELLERLGNELCAEHPALLVPFDADEANVH